MATAKVGKKKAKRKVATPPSAKVWKPASWAEMLDLLDEFFAVGNEDAGILWDVLAGAVRGPDRGSHELKAATTIHLRHAAFPKTAGKPNGVVAGNRAIFTTEYAINLDVAYNGGSHFASHINDAARALKSRL